MELAIIPIKPHLKSFIYSIYRSDPGMPLKVEENDLTELGQILYQVITDKRTLNKGHDAFSERLAVVLPKRMSQRSPRINKLVRINLLYDRSFKRQMFTWIEAQGEVGIPAYQSVELFLKHYNISERDYAKESAYRSWTRWKNEEYRRNKK